MGGDLLVRGGQDADGTPCEVAVVAGRVADGRTPEAARVLDARGLTVLPGLVDLQVNGAAGVDLTATPDRLWECAAALPAFGVTAFMPTIITSAPRARERAVEVLVAGPPAGWRGAVPLGLHFEGPMIAETRKGAHPPRWLVPPSLELVSGWTPERGVRMVTIAPELPGALAVIEELAGRGVLVSVGHTEATSAQTEAAVAAGARLVTHLGNAMAPLLTRAAGPIGAALGGSELVAGIIPDGHHVDPLVLALAWRALGPTRFLTVTDTTMALGMPDGPGRLGDQEVVVADGTVRLADGTLAGSAASLPQCLHELRRATSCTLGEAVATCTTTPAAVLGDGSRGHLAPGARGDLTVVDEDLRVVATVVGGHVAYAAGEVG